MGYYTNYTLRVHDGDADLIQVKRRLDEIMEMLGPESCFEVVDDEIVSVDTLKWYDHDEEVAHLSKSFPGVVFELHGEGEGVGDIWNAYYRDGLCQICRAEIVIPEYNPAELKTVHDAQIADRGRL